MVTVVIPTRDRWALVRTAARLAREQEGVDARVVVVDDGSATADGLGGLDVEMVRNEVSQGVSRARNTGLAVADSEWVAFLDDDDLWAPGHLQGLLAAAAGADMVCSGCGVVDLERRVIGIREAPPEAGIVRALHSENVIPTPSGVLLRTAAVRAAGGFDPALSVNADWDLWLKVAREGRVARTDGLTVGYTMHPGNMHVDPDLMLDEMTLIRARYGVEAAAWGVPLPGRDFAAYVAAGYRRQGRRATAARWYARSAARRRRPADLVRAGGALVVPAGIRLQRVDDRAAASERLSWLRAVDR